MQSLGRGQSECGTNLTRNAALCLQSGEGALNLSIMVKEFEMTKKLVKMGFDVNKPCERVLRPLLCLMYYFGFRMASLRCIGLF